MSKDGRIGNRQLLKAKADALQMEGVNRMPSMLNRDQVQVTADLGTAGFAGRFTQFGGVTNFPMAGLAAHNQPICGFANAAFQCILPTNNNLGPLMDSRILSLWCALEFDAAGAIAFNNKGVSLSLEFANFSGANVIGRIHHLDPWVDIGSLILRYVWAMGGYCNDNALVGTSLGNGVPGTLWVPSEISLRLTITSYDGTVFPANTVLQVQGVAVHQPSGSQLPL